MVFSSYHDFVVMNKYGNLFDLQGLSLDRLRNFLLVVDAGRPSKAAPGDSNRQSLFSRQIKELEGFFGVALTSRAGRQIEITEEGHRLAKMIRQQFREMSDFRNSMAGRATTLRIGSQGSVIEWLLISRLEALRASLGNVVLEMEQMRSRDTVDAVRDGRLDLGIVREDALPPEMKRWKLGQVGYAVFAAKDLWKGCRTPEELLAKAPIAELHPGGQFASRLSEWMQSKKLHPKTVARTSSFTDLAKIAKSGVAAVVLPDLASVDFSDQQFRHEPIKALKSRQLALVANMRNSERLGLASKFENLTHVILSKVEC